MTFDFFLKQVHQARRRSALINHGTEAAIFVCGIALLVVTIGVISRWGAAIILIGGIGAFVVLLIKRQWLSLPLFEETCARVDEKLDLKSRATSLYYARRESTTTHRTISPIIESQLARISLPDPHSSSLAEPISWRKVRVLATTLALIGLIVGFRKPPAINGESGNAAEILEEFLAENPELPKEAAEQLQTLADTIRSEGLGSEAVEDTIATTLNSLDNLDEQAGSAEAKKSEEAEQSGAPSASATATPTPTPTPKPSRQTASHDDKTEVQHAQESPSNSDTEKSPSKEQKSENDPSNGEKGKTADKGDKGNSDRKSGSAKEGETSAGAGSDNKKKDSKESSGGEGEGDTKANQSGGKNESSEGSGTKGQQSSSPGGSNKGAQQQGPQGAAGEGQAGGQEGEGEQAGSQGSVGKSGQPSPQQEGNQQGAGGKGDAEAEGKTTQQGAGKGEPSSALKEARGKVASLSKNQDNQAEVSGDKSSDQSLKSSEPPSAKKGRKQGDAKKDTASANEEKAKSSGKGRKQGKDPEKQSASDSSNSGNGDGEFTNNPPGQSASVGDRSADKVLMEGKEGGLDGPKGFKNSVVEEKGLEKVDPKFGKETGKISEHTNPAEFKRSLKKIPLAQPDAVVSKSEQPIPLEYRGVLGSE